MFSQWAINNPSARISLFFNFEQLLHSNFLHSVVWKHWRMVGNQTVTITFLFLHLYHLISWSCLLILSILMFQTISRTIINHSHQFHLGFTLVSPLFHFHLWCFITFYTQPCTAVYSCAQPHLVVYIFSSLHWCTPVLTLSISWSVIDARLSLAYGFPTEYWPHLVIQSA